MRSFLLVALLSCAAFCAGAQELPAVPGAPSSVDAAALSAAPNDPSLAGQEFASLAVRLPLLGPVNDPAAVLENRYLISPQVLPATPEKARRILDSKFLLMIAAGTSLTVLDFEMTQSCMAREICREANPLVPTSRAGMYATNIPLNAVLYYWSYRRRASGKRLWWVAPLAIIGSHAVGVASNVPFMGQPAR